MDISIEWPSYKRLEHFNKEMWMNEYERLDGLNTGNVSRKVGCKLAKITDRSNAKVFDDQTADICLKLLLSDNILSDFLPYLKVDKNNSYNNP